MSVQVLPIIEAGVSLWDEKNINAKIGVRAQNMQKTLRNKGGVHDLM